MGGHGRTVQEEGEEAHDGVRGHDGHCCPESGAVPLVGAQTQEAEANGELEEAEGENGADDGLPEADVLEDDHVWSRNVFLVFSEAYLPLKYETDPAANGA